MRTTTYQKHLTLTVKANIELMGQKHGRAPTSSWVSLWRTQQCPRELIFQTGNRKELSLGKLTVLCKYSAFHVGSKD